MFKNPTHTKRRNSLPTTQIYQKMSRLEIGILKMRIDQSAKPQFSEIRKTEKKGGCTVEHIYKFENKPWEYCQNLKGLTTYPLKPMRFALKVVRQASYYGLSEHGKIRLRNKKNRK